MRPPAAPRRATLRWAAAVAVAALVGGLGVAPASARPAGSGGVAQPAPTTTVPEPKTPAEVAAAKKALEDTLALAPPADEVPPSPDDPFAAVVDADRNVADKALVRLDATARSDEANLAALIAVKAKQDAQAREERAQDRRDAAARELETERKRLSDLTVRAFVTGGDADMEQYRALLEGDTSDATGGRNLMFGQVLERQKEVTEQAWAALTAARKRLLAARDVLAAAIADADIKVADAQAKQAARSQAERDHLEAIAEADGARQRLRTAGNGPFTPAPLELPLIGIARLAPEDLAGWFEHSTYRPRVSTPIADYARWFIEEGNAEGIRGDIAFAQAVLETGGFANTDSVEGNNFSGIGHYDNVPRGFSFPSPQAGVRAQIQLLKSYAVRKPEYANPLVDKRLHGPAGCCKTWNDLTRKWATDPGYGPKVMFLYSAIVDYALDRRAAGEGMDAPTA
jgi:hypothetical protein